MKKASILVVFALLAGCSSSDTAQDGAPPARDITVVSGDRGAEDRGVPTDVLANSDGGSLVDLSVPADLPPGVDSAPSSRGWPLNTGWIVAVDGQEGGAILATKDAYLLSTSAFDRSFLTQTVGAVTVDQLAAHLGQLAGDWSAAERTRLQTIVASIHQRMQGYNLPFPQQMFLIKGAGFMPSHTRGAAIYVGREGLGLDDGKLEELLTHELWHVLSRNAPSLREQLYAVIEYRPCGVVQRPPELVDLWLSNPDARYQYCITLTYGSQYDFMPVTYASAAFNSSTGSDLSNVMQFSFLGVQAGATESLPLYESGGTGPLLLVPPYSLMTEHAQKAGSNTDYVIHPDEIVADNFAYLFLQRQNLPSPQITQGIDAVLSAL